MSAKDFYKNGDVTKMRLEDIAKTYFDCEYGFFDFPVVCRGCKDSLNTVSGIVTHMKKTHGIYTKRLPQRIVKIRREFEYKT